MEGDPAIWPPGYCPQGRGLGYYLKTLESRDGGTSWRDTGWREDLDPRWELNFDHHIRRVIPVADGSRTADGRTVSAASQLSQWPIQLNLVSPFAPYFQNADLLVAADCTAFALGGFHQDLLKGKKLVIACPKLDETEGYVEKLAEIIRRNNLKSLTVAIMTVPCCAGLFRLVQRAVELAEVDVPLRRVVVGIEGRVVQPAA